MSLVERLWPTRRVFLFARVHEGLSSCCEHSLLYHNHLYDSLLVHQAFGFQTSLIQSTCSSRKLKDIMHLRSPPHVPKLESCNDDADNGEQEPENAEKDCLI